MPVSQTPERLEKNLVLANIPAFPPVVLRVLDLLSAEQPDKRLLVQEIAQDATLSAQLLRLANAPLFGLMARVQTVDQAVLVLGLDRVQSLVLSVTTANYMRAALRTDALQKCWRHTMAAAMLSRELARACRLSPECAYSLSLLHDIGRLGLLVAYPREYSRILNLADRDGVSLLDQEKALFGMDHCEAGRRLLEQSKLPEEFCRLAGRHHDPPDGGPVDSLLIGHLACQMADTLGYSVVTPLRRASFEELRALLPAAAQARFPVDAQVVANIIQEAIREDDPLSEDGACPSTCQPAESRGEAVSFLSTPASSRGGNFAIILLVVIAFTLVLLGSRWFWAL